MDLAKSGNTEPIKQLACSIGLHPDDTGDYYTCDQMHYAAADGSDAGLSYWLLHLGHHDVFHGQGWAMRRLEPSIEGTPIPASNPHGAALTAAAVTKRRLQGGGWHPKIGLCFPSECSQRDLDAAAPYIVRSLNLNCTTSGPPPGSAHASAQANATQFWIKDVEQTGGPKPFDAVRSTGPLPLSLPPCPLEP